MQKCTFFWQHIIDPLQPLVSSIVHILCGREDDRACGSAQHRDRVMQISRFSIVRNRTIRCCGFRSRVALPVAEPFCLMMHLERCSVSVFHSFTDLRNILIRGQKGKVKSLLRCLFRKPKRPNFSAALFKKRLHLPHAISHCSLLISLKSCYRLKVRNFHSASAEQFRSS